MATSPIHIPLRHEWQTLAEIVSANIPGGEGQAIETMLEAVRGLRLPAAHVERLERIAAEAISNAAQRCAAPTTIHVLAAAASLAGPSPTQAWSFFVVEGTTRDAACNLIEVFLYLEGGTSEKP